LIKLEALALLVFTGAALALAEPADNDIASIPATTNSPDPADLPVLPAPVLPDPATIPAPDDSGPPGVKWKPLLKQSLGFLLIENTFRFATEAATRDSDLPYFKGYVDAVGALHGWSDGDPFFVNYVGHPMQGAVSAYLWIQNDPRYTRVEFGRNRDYWRSRLRAAGWAWAYSEWTEIGPLISEAAIGHVQAFYPQQGFVDHVATPAIGLAWLIAEDAMDRYLVRYVERKTTNRYVRILVRGAANPARSLANVLGGQVPWARPRDDGREYVSYESNKRPPKPQDTELRPGVAPFELAANTYLFPTSGGPCLGGGATAAFRIQPEWQVLLDVNGCKMTGLEKNLSGDSLSYMTGMRWTPSSNRRLIPYVQVLVGGNKLTQELFLPGKKAALPPPPSSCGCAPGWDHQQYTEEFERDGFAFAAGMGLDLQFNHALALRLADVEYTRSWTHDLNGFPAPRGIQVKLGLVLHMGTW
jgi:hypothetical protein